MEIIDSLHTKAYTMSDNTLHLQRASEKLESMSSLTHIRQGGICHKDLTFAPLKKNYFLFLFTCLYSCLSMHRCVQIPTGAPDAGQSSGGCEHLLTWVLELNGVLCMDSKCSQCWTIFPISLHFLLITKHNLSTKLIFVPQSLPWSCNTRIYDKVTFTERQWAETFVSL